MSKNIVVCCDGTGNQVEGNLSNVLKLFRVIQKNDGQRAYYNPGVGTLATDDPWSRLKENFWSVFGLATGYGLDAEILGAYRFLIENYEDGDAIYLFGFSRGSYTVRALAGFIHTVGLLHSDQINIADYALVAYKRSSEKNNLQIAWNFGRIAAARTVTIKFIGVWDTVASVIVPRLDRLYPAMQTLPYTRNNSCVEVFRQAIAIDERRTMFRLNRWSQPQNFVADPFHTDAPKVAQDIKQVWFAGVHSDVGGGYPEPQCGLSKFALAWLIDEAAAHGLKINIAMKNQLALGMPRPGSKEVYVAPDAAAQLHQSLTWAWWLIEWVPKPVKYEDWPRPHFLGCYIPWGEPRMIQQPFRPRIHQSVLDRMKRVPDYKPVNFPRDYDVEPWPYDAAPAAPAEPTT
jgi:uncharacterized protein (DUF2235 family)